MSVPIALIAAVARNGVIGRNGGIPWKIPGDMAFFKRQTMGKPIIMGRKQFETIGKPLPGRVNLVVSRQVGYQPDGVIVISSLADALDHAKHIAADGADEVMVIGGGEIYSQAIGSADRLYISEVDLAPEGDVFFPPIDAARWQIVASQDIQASPRNEAVFSDKLYVRTFSI